MYSLENNGFGTAFSIQEEDEDAIVEKKSEPSKSEVRLDKTILPLVSELSVNKNRCQLCTTIYFIA